MNLNCQNPRNEIKFVVLNGKRFCDSNLGIGLSLSLSLRAGGEKEKEKERQQ